MPENSTFASRATQRAGTKQTKRDAVETKVVDTDDAETKADEQPARKPSRARKS